MTLWPKQTRAEVLAYDIAHPKDCLLNSARARAKNKDIAFGITVDDFEIPLLCPYLKVPLERGTRYAPSLDRIDNRLGYVPGNVEVISRKANTMKNDASVAELLEFAYTILERH